MVPKFLGFDEFDVSAGPLPKADSMQLKALQTYPDGKSRRGRGHICSSMITMPVVMTALAT